MPLIRSLVMAVTVLLPVQAVAQDHAAHHQRGASGPAEAGQAAFAAIKEIVAILEADSATDWSRVNLEALRRHLITMDRVMMESLLGIRRAGASVILTYYALEAAARC